MPRHCVVAKFCVFCGEPPIEQNKEHVLPQWLLEHTGDPNRQVSVSVRYDFEKDTAKPLSFAFSHLQFPSCKRCNDNFGSLEARVQQVMQALHEEREINEGAMTILLDWFDKIRVGMWLGELQLGGNVLEVKPNFYVADRVGTADRMLFISKIAPSKALTVIGTRTPLFAFMPCVFGLRINELVFINVSTDWLLSRQLGFPYAEELVFDTQSSAYTATLAGGTGAIALPLSTLEHKVENVCLAQPMFKRLVRESPKTFDNKHVRTHSLIWDQGVGRVFGPTIISDVPLSRIAAQEYKQMSVYDRGELRAVFNNIVLDWQCELTKSLPKYREDDTAAAGRRERWQWAVGINRSLSRAL